MLSVTLAQAGGLRETCALWVPLYRQVTIEGAGTHARRESLGSSC